VLGRYEITRERSAVASTTELSGPGCRTAHVQDNAFSGRELYSPTVWEFDVTPDKWAATFKHIFLTLLYGFRKSLKSL
jgi:hypothetical protein